MLRGSDGEASFWSVDDPPESQVHGSGPLKIYGLEIAGGDDQAAVISHVRRQSPEAAAGIREGQRVESVSGRKVGTIGQLRQLLDEHRQHPWLRIRPAALRAGIRPSRSTWPSIAPCRGAWRSIRRSSTARSTP